MVRKYVTVKIPEELTNLIDKFIDEEKELGYRNRSEFIIEAIRDRLMELEKLKKSEK